MAGTRSSSRLAAQSISPASSQANSSPKPAAGMKRKSETASSPTPKRGKNSAPKEQKTIEESFENINPAPPVAETAASEKGAVEAPEGKIEVPRQDGKAGNADESGKEHAEVTAAKENGDVAGDRAANGTSRMDETGVVEPNDKQMADAVPTNGENTAVEPGARDDQTPSSILEKGIIYFFFRSRVNITEPQDTSDIARSYMIMRPIPHGAKLGDGPIGDDGNSRLLALPKKILPLSGKDRFMVFVEKAKTSFAELKDNFLSASDYATKTAGTSHAPAPTPVGEGVYALTTTGRESHLAYILTIPSELGEVQKDIGLRERGSFITSIKNPEQKGPANASLPEGPGYPKEIMDEFRNLRWMPAQPRHLDYANAQLLIIGESSGIEKATEQLPRDEKNDKDTPLEEMDKLEHEDQIRVKHLKGDDTVFADLGLTSKDLPKFLTTW